MSFSFSASTETKVTDITSDIARQSVLEALKKAANFKGTSSLNAKVVQHLLQNQEDEQFYSTGRFALLSQNFCSPLVPRPNGLNQTGLFSVEGNTKYIRSEIGAATFGLPYNRNQVLIRSAMAESFRDLCSSYMTPSSRRMVTMNALTFNDDGIAEITEQLKDENVAVIYIIDPKKQFNEQRAYIQELLRERESDIAVVIEQPFSVKDYQSPELLDVQLCDAGLYQFRYQMLQDTASMGYRPYLSSAFDFYATQGSIESHIHDAPFVANHEIFKRRKISHSSSEDFEERIEDFKLLAAVIGEARKNLESLQTFSSPLHRLIHTEASTECQKIIEQVDLQLAAAKASETISASSHAYHDLYTQIRSVLQYVGLLQSSNPQQEGWRRKTETGIEMHCNSGMTATRVALTHLLPEVSKVYSTAHYWETDFLIENYVLGNPHFNQVPHEQKNMFVQIPVPAEKAQIEKIFSDLVEHDKTGKGQLVCADALIAPFFFTKRFALADLCSLIQNSQYQFEHPVYLVVDNTLDSYRSNVAELFPHGLPENVFFIETTSLAKLHQFGFDVVTGGRIRGAAHGADQQTLISIMSDMERKILAEDSHQSTYGQAILDSVFLAVGDSLQGADLLKHMEAKRQRNSTLIYSAVREQFRQDMDQSSTTNLAAESPLLIQNPFDSQIEHKVGVSFHYEPSSGLHLYIRLFEEKGPPFIGGVVFERLKDRIIDRCFGEGVLIGDGTSWGFRNTRIDWYMHTMRIATGLEHRTTVTQIGNIISEELRALCEDPNEYVTKRHCVKLAHYLRLYGDQARDEIESLLKLIPHDPNRFEDLAMLLNTHPNIKNSSMLAVEKGEIVGLVIGYPTDDGFYISKAVTRKEQQGKGVFKELLAQIEKTSRASGIDNLYLETSASQLNEPVVHAYQSCGFTVDPDRHIAWLSNGWPLITITLRKSLQDQSDQLTPPKFLGVGSDEYQKLFEQGSAASHTL